MKYLTITYALILFCPFHTIGQQTIRLDKGKIDTICVFLEQTNISDEKLTNELQRQFDSIVIDFNNQLDRSLKLVIDGSRSTHTIKFVMGDIKYVDSKKRILIAGINIVCLGIDILIFPFPPVFPFYLSPCWRRSVTCASLKNDDIYFF